MSLNLYISALIIAHTNITSFNICYYLIHWQHGYSAVAIITVRDKTAFVTKTGMFLIFETTAGIFYTLEEGIILREINIYYMFARNFKEQLSRHIFNFFIFFYVENPINADR